MFTHRYYVSLIPKVSNEQVKVARFCSVFLIALSFLAPTSSRRIAIMNIEGTFIGSLTTTSTKLKQTVSLNRRTISNLDHEIYRYKREKDKNTLQIKREKEKFLAKQSRLLPTIPIHYREDELLKRNNAASRTLKPRPKSTVYLPTTTRATPSPPLCRRVVNDKTRGVEYAPSPPLSKRSVAVRNENSPRGSRRFEYSHSPTLSKRLIGHEEIRALPLDLNKCVQIIPLRQDDGALQKRTTKPRSRSFSDLPEKRKEVEVIAIERWRKIRDNLQFLISLESMTNFSIACEKLQDCRYIRQTRLQMMSNTSKQCKTRCYCNTCSVSRSRFVH